MEGKEGNGGMGWVGNLGRETKGGREMGFWLVGFSFIERE